MGRQRDGERENERAKEGFGMPLHMIETVIPFMWLDMQGIAYDRRGTCFWRAIDTRQASALADLAELLEKLIDMDEEHYFSIQDTSKGPSLDEATVIDLVSFLAHVCLFISLISREINHFADEIVFSIKELDPEGDQGWRLY